MTETIAYRPILLQHGYSDGASFVSFSPSIGDFPSPQQLLIPAGATYTQIYDFEINNDTERGLQLDPPNFFTQASESLYFNLTMSTNLAAPRSDIGLQFQTGPLAAEWQPAPDNDIVENATDWQSIENPIAADSDVWVLNGSTYDLVFNLDFNTQYGSGSTESIQRTIKKPTWNGLLSLGFPNSGAGYRIIVDTTVYNRGFIAGQYVPFYTGWDNCPGSRGRPVPDMKTGLPAFAEDLVEDGYTPGIWTRQQSWDPVDPRDLFPVVFPSNESEKEDDVPV